MIRLLGSALLLMLAATPVAATTLTVEGTEFILVTDAGERLSSAQLVGAVLEMTDPGGNSVTARIDAVAPAKERAATLLHTLSVRVADGSFVSMCEPDAYGRQAGFPVAGHVDARGRFTCAPGNWFLTCTSGSQAKCILWGYDPATRGPQGEDLAPFYEACQNLVRANYDGRGAAHTRDGTSIDLWDVARIQTPDSAADADYAFEAGWGVDGAVCVAQTRIPDLLPLSVLLASAPHLRAVVCDEAEAKRRGALIFNRSKVAGQAALASTRAVNSGSAAMTRR